MTELGGPSPSGKTQLCHAAAAAAAKEGLRAVFVSTTNAFSAERAAQMLGGADRGALGRIRVEEVSSAEDLVQTLQRLRAELRPSGKGGDSGAQLLVVDCPAPALATVLSPNQTHGHAVLAVAARLLKVAAEELAAAVVVTNYPAWDGDDPASAERFALGEAWRGQFHCRILLRAENLPPLGRLPPRDLLCTATLLHAPSLPPGGRARFWVRETGLCPWAGVGEEGAGGEEAEEEEAGGIDGRGWGGG